MQTLKFIIPKMACGNCFNIIKNASLKLNGVSAISCDLKEKSVSLEFDENATNAAAISDKLKKIGFPPENE